MSDLHIANVHPFNFVCFSQQKTQNQQKSIKFLPKSEQNHGYLRFFALHDRGIKFYQSSGYISR